MKTGFPCVHISTLFLLQGILLSMQGNGPVLITGIFEQIQSFQFILWWRIHSGRTEPKYWYYAAKVDSSLKQLFLS